MAGIYYGYDLLGDLLYARYGSANGDGATFTYDALQRKTSETSTGTGYSRTMSSTYDLAGNRTRLTWPDGNYIQYTYDALNRMKQVRQNGAAVMAEYSYDDLGREAGIARNNAANTTMAYNVAADCSTPANTREWCLQQGGAMSPAVTFNMSYTPAGQVSQRTISNANYQYGVTASGTNYCPNGLNQYATAGGSGSGCSGGAAYSYDAQGNLTSDGARSFSYNLANQLTGATTGSGSATITYDPLGRLQQVGAASTTRYLYDGAMLVAEYDTSGTMLHRYVPGQGVDETLIWYEGADLSSPHWLHTDQQGSVIAATDSSATATPYAYSATGEPKGGWSSSAPAFRYTGQVAIPSAALYFYKARMYDPALGRFLQTDPTGYNAGMNLYTYVGNNYVNAGDPLGLCANPENSTVDCTDQIESVTVHGPRFNDNLLTDIGRVTEGTLRSPALRFTIDEKQQQAIREQETACEGGELGATLADAGVKRQISNVLKLARSTPNGGAGGQNRMYGSEYGFYAVRIPLYGMYIGNPFTSGQQRYVDVPFTWITIIPGATVIHTHQSPDAAPGLSGADQDLARSLLSGGGYGLNVAAVTPSGRTYCQARR